jgi:tRNA nucleotidyltransferase/poly(A) polymerase
VSLAPTPPRRPLIWPPLVERLAAIAPDPASLYLVGGIVRDALRGVPGHDIDLATPADGLRIARQIADALGGAYYPVDPQRGTGRVIVADDGAATTLDVASLRGDDLLADLQGRDFTVNAMAVPLNDLTRIVDPLDGQRDLFDIKVLRQCSPSSIPHDPIRALRAVRQSLQLRLRIDKTTLTAIRSAGPRLLDDTGALHQPERARDEFFKILAGTRPASALRLLHTLGLLAPLCPFDLPPDHNLSASFTHAEKLDRLFAIISPRRDDDTAAELILGVAVMILDRFRRQLQEHLSLVYGQGRSRSALLMLAAFSLPITPDETLWKTRFHLSNAESYVLRGITQAHQTITTLPRPVDDRAIYRYYRAAGIAGVDGVLLMLAGYLAAHWPTVDAQDWGHLLEEVAAPLLDAAFRRHQQVIAPPPLLTGDDLKQHLNLPPGPHIGQITERLLEEQAAGEIRTRSQALRLARRLADEIHSGTE